MTGLIILILLIIVVPYVWRLLKPYLLRWATRKTADYVRKSMGMPPHGNETRDKGHTQGYRRQTRSGRRGGGYHSGPIIPKEYAEDVEFTEIHSFSDETEINSDGRSIRIEEESQVSDAEIIEIKKEK